MALTPAEQDLITKFDTATSAVAARIQALLNSQGAADLSPEAVAAFQAEVDKLNAMGASGTPPTA